MTLVKTLFATFCAFFVMGPSAGQASELRTMTYDVYAGGIHALDATLTMQEGSKDYYIELKSATHGLLGTLAPWSGVFETKGKITAKGDVFPVSHISASTWKGETEQKSYTYDGAGHFLTYKVTEANKDKTPGTLDKDLTVGTLDTLTATYSVLRQLPKTKSCTGSSLIFDGDRNFKLSFQDPNAEEMPKSEYNMYQGPAMSCVVEVTPQKGKWKQKPRGWLSIQEQGRQIGALPLVWFGQPDATSGDGADKDASKSPYIPVKIRVKTNYGILFMHLTSYKVTAASPQPK